MAIPETQLETWSHIGSVTQSSDTYQTIRRALLDTGSPYADKSFDVFLQGSYGNDTNIYAESDVDIVINLKACFFHDLESLPSDQQAAFHSAYPNAASYGLSQFKTDVQGWLESKYGASVKPGNKAVQIEADGNRRKADVLIAAEFRRYLKFQSSSDVSHTTGICFFNKAGTRIANYPRQHSANCTTKHQATSSWLKPTVRILKNLRGKLIDEKMIEVGEAPSYYLEGLLYNVPDDNFGKNYVSTVANCLNWLVAADRSKFVCANQQYYLLREDSEMTWRAGQCTKFLNAACELWRQW